MRPHPAQQLRAPTALPPSGPEILPAFGPHTAIGPWRLTERLTATAYGAIDSVTGADVVVKVISPSALEGEVTALCTLEHPHLVRFAGSVDGVVATERVLGPTLTAVLAEQGPLPWATAAGLLAPIADALAAVHTAGWVHGDVAPPNIVVGNAGAVLVDLGHARPLAAAMAAGTPGSVAPEVEAGAPGGTASDVWSLAAVVVEAVTGSPPNAATALPAGVALALRRALAADPADRPSAAELAAALRAGAVSLPNSSASVAESGTLTLENRVTRDYGPRPPAPVVATDRPARRRWPVVVAGIATVAGLGFVVAPRPSATPAATPAPPPACPPVGSGTVVGDPDGDGCPTAAQWVEGVLTVVVEPGTAPRRYAIGAPGDVVALGDWNCDGIDTPGLFRPSTGVISLFDTWPVTTDTAAPSVVATGEGLPDSDC